MKYNTQKNLTPEDINVGELYNVRLKCITSEIGIGLSEFSFVTVDSQGNAICDDLAHFFCFDLPAFSPISPSEPPTSVGTAPTHDPCREYRAGDKVKLKTHFGRTPYNFFTRSEYIPDETVFTVLYDEWPGGKVDLYEKAESDSFSVHFSNLELVTPVEDLDPYIVEKSTDGATLVLTVKKRACSQGLEFRYCPGWGGNIFFSENQCRKHAEAECARLNEEYRKEQA